jgi:CHASE3 domain sensor protein
MSTATDYQIMRDSIQRNIEAIRLLLKEADDLTQAVDDITDNAPLKKQLSEHVTALHVSIDNLVEQTNKLFQQYIDLANSVVNVS